VLANASSPNVRKDHATIVEFGHVIKNCPQTRTEKKEVANVEGEAVEEQ